MGTNRVIITCYCQLLAAEPLNVWLFRILWHVCIQLLGCDNDMMVISLNLFASKAKVCLLVSSTKTHQ